MTMNSTVHEALVKEALATGVEATMEHFDMMYSGPYRSATLIIPYYKARSKQFSR